MLIMLIWNLGQRKLWSLGRGGRIISQSTSRSWCSRLAVQIAWILLAMITACNKEEPPQNGWFTESRIVSVRESDQWVDTDLVLEANEDLMITATGQIWAGVALTGTNGPEGWNNVDNDPKFPLPGSRPYALIGKLNGSVFYVGAKHQRTMISGPGRLYLRTNDDAPGNGNGEFIATITVKRTGVQSWAVLLCKASDVTSEPHTMDYYRQLLSSYGAGTDNVYDYWMSASSRYFLLNPVIEGWYTMAVNKAKLDARCNGCPQTRAQTAIDCINAAKASGSTLETSNFRGVIAIVNIGTDHGHAGGNRVVIGDTGNPIEASFVEQEMAHAFGLLVHSWRTGADQSPIHIWNNGGDVEYGDCWDVMSYATCAAFTFTPAPYGPQGPEFHGEFRAQLGWITPSLIYTARPAAKETITLSAINRTYTSGYRLARIPVGQLGYYAVELRQKADFDRNIPGTAILIREVRAGSSATYLVSGLTGPAWQPGQVFQDAQNRVKITIDAFSGSDLANVTIDTQ